MKRIYLFEDEGALTLRPLTWTRPVYALRCGICTLEEKAIDAFAPCEVWRHARDYLAALVKEQSGCDRVNAPPPGETLLLNGRVLWSEALAKRIESDPGERVFSANGTLVAARVCDPTTLARIDWRQPMPSDMLANLPASEIQARVIAYPWDLIAANPSEIVEDAKTISGHDAVNGLLPQETYRIGDHPISLGDGALIDPCVTLDAQSGPIVIGAQARIMPHSYLQGPCAIGPGSVVKPGARIYEGTSCGPVCKLGGEIEASILHAYANKQHDGFLGHAYLGTWVNIAAGTNNSDLRNDYAVVQCMMEGKRISTGLQFFGMAVGDHSKTAIQTMLNTGTLAGVFCQIFGSGFPPKWIPNYSWGAPGGWAEYRFEKAVETARLMMRRRDRTLTRVEEEVYRAIFEMTVEERALFFQT